MVILLDLDGSLGSESMLRVLPIMRSNKRTYCYCDDVLHTRKNATMHAHTHKQAKCEKDGNCSIAFSMK